MPILTMAFLKQLFIKVLPFLLFGLLLAGIWAYHSHSVHTAYDQGHKDGVNYQQNLQKEADNELASQRQKEKEALERNAQSQIAQAQSDADFAHATVDRLRSQLDAVKQLAESNTGSQPVGASAVQTVRVLAELFQESLERNRALAKFADASYNAGQLCERSYDALRGLNAGSEN